MREIPSNLCWTRINIVPSVPERTEEEEWEEERSGWFCRSGECGMEEKPGNWSQKHLPLTPGSWASVSSSIKQAQSQPLHVALGRIRDNIWPFPEYTIDAGSKVVIIRWLKKFKEGSVQIQNISPFFYSRDLKVRQQISASRQEIQAAGTFLASSYPAPLLAMNCAAPVF